jgi:G protein beta subunit-like protein
MSRVVLATAGYDHKVNLWEPPSGVCSRTLRFSDSQVNRLCITPDKQFLAAAGNPHVRLFEVASQNPNPVVAYDGHTTNVTDVGFQKDGKWMFTGSEDGSIKIWDLRAPGCQRNYVCKAPVHSLSLHPNQAELISGDQLGRVKVWDLTANKSIDIDTKGNSDPIQSISVATDASLIVGATNKGMVFVFEPAADGRSYAMCSQFRAHPEYLLKCVLSPNVRQLVTTGSDKVAKVWNVGGNWELERCLSQHQRWVWDAVFSADSSYLVTASSDHTAKLWELRTGEVIRNYIGHSNAVTCVALNDSTQG